MVLLISLLLLTASAGLLMESSMNTQNVSDATAEQQAYNAAESGLQATINVLRGNVIASPLLDTSKPATDPANLISFRKAITKTTSNKDTRDTAKLSRWLNYNYKSSGSAVNDRITLGVNAAAYTPQTGFAYSVDIVDTDQTGDAIDFNTSGQFFDSTNNSWATNTKTYDVGGMNTRFLNITYTPVIDTRAAINTTSGLATATDFGKFTITTIGSGTTVMNEDIRFQIIVNMTAPYSTTKVMRGWIKVGKVDLGTATNIQFDFDSPAYDVMGSSFTHDAEPLSVPLGKTTPVSPTTISGKVTQAEPFRLLVRSVGYGPRGARKELEAIVQKNFFNGLSAPATLTLIGEDAAGFTFIAGSSQQVTYSGKNVVGAEIIPSIGTSNQANLNKVLANLDGKGSKADITGYPANVSQELPFWLQSPDNLDKTIRDLKRVAVSSGRYFSGGAEPSTIGNLSNATGITFVDGDLTIRQDGGGILIVTGKLTLHGAFKFNGLIIVTGREGISRSGGGNGFLEGNTVIAPYDPALVTPENPYDTPAKFFAPKYDISGGGNSEVVYNSNSVKNGMTAVSNFVLGVAEK